MKAVYGMMVTTAAMGLMIAAAGCGPKMAETPLSPEEEKWASYIGSNYSAWEKPQTIPSGVRRNDISENTVVSVDEATGVANGVTKETAVTGYGETTVVARVTEPAAQPELPAEEAAAPEKAAEEPAAEAAPAEAAPAEAAPEKAAAAEPVLYTVQKGDSLGGIALKHYGKASAWTKIQKANESVLKGKTVIRPGMKLVLPQP